jgi:hypothetical protein
LIQKLTGSGISPDLAKLLSDRLANLFKSTPAKVRKWQVNADIFVDDQQLLSTVNTFNMAINTMSASALTNPPDEVIAIREILAQLVASSVPKN